MPGGPIGSVLPPAFLDPGTSGYQYSTFTGDSRPASEDGVSGDERPETRPSTCSTATGRFNAADRRVYNANIGSDGQAPYSLHHFHKAASGETTNVTRAPTRLLRTDSTGGYLHSRSGEYPGPRFLILGSPRELFRVLPRSQVQRVTKTPRTQGTMHNANCRKQQNFACLRKTLWQN